MSIDLEALALRVHRAAQAGQAIPMLTGDEPSLSIEQAYRLQRLSMAQRCAQGELIVGMKMGLTSKAKMAQMGVHEPIYGHLSDRMAIVDGGSFSMSGRCHPRVEPELAFRLSGDLKGKVSRDQAAAAVQSVHPALEIIDSRYTDFKFTLIDVVADNTSACGFVVGPGQALKDQALEQVELRLDVGGREQLVGTGEAIYGHPLDSLCELVSMLDRVGEGLVAGQWVLAGAATAAVALQAGDQVRLETSGLGGVSFQVEDS